MNEKRKPTHSEQEIDRAIDRALGHHDANDQIDTNDPLLLEMEQAAAILDLAVASTHPIEMPDGLTERLKSQAAQYPDQDNTIASTQRQNEPPQSFVLSRDSAQKGAPSRWVPWMVAAASLTIAAISIFMPRDTQITKDLNAQRLALIESTPTEELTRWDWISTDDAAVISDVIGDVVWSDALNKGYMRISGLAINDPSMDQYQLWIFDTTRPTGELPQFGEGLLTQRPIDGGVFDVNEDGEVIIEINAKLFVQNAAAFAVTVEPPGGVVVSDRSRVPLLALAP